MNEALLWLFLFQPVVDNQILIEVKEKEKTCAHNIYLPCKCKKNKKSKNKGYQKAIYHQSQSTDHHKEKSVYS